MAALISRNIPGTEATAEVTTASVDNMNLIHTGRVALALTLPDTAWDAYNGKLKGLNEKIGVRSLMALYTNFMHIAALDGSGIKSVADLRGKRVSTGAPGSGTEVKALRVMEAYGVMSKDLQSQERLGAGESAGALKDRKIDAFFWDGGLPNGGNSRSRRNARQQSQSHPSRRCGAEDGIKVRPLVLRRQYSQGRVQGRR